MNDFDTERLKLLEAQQLKKSIDGPIALFFSRLVMPLITSGFMMVGGWLMTHIDKAVDDHTSKLAKVERSVDRIDQFISLRETSEKNELDSIKIILADHETRLRDLERSISRDRGLLLRGGK